MAEAFGIACQELVSLDFRCGSKPVISRPHRERLLLGVKQTKSARKRTSGHKGRLGARHVFTRRAARRYRPGLAGVG